VQNAISYSKQKITAEVHYLKTSVKIIITDDGNGYSKEIIDRLGEPYVTNNKQGMGLGIFIAKNLIENMGGNLKLYNSKENNAVVEITFDNSILDI
ncbi:ATP-binding protein, partial [Pelagibacteraceae bacterium]|nr:ATP-binding protein [Pelagibacteraceae bacterium]